MNEDSEATTECLRQAGLLLAALHDRPLRPITGKPDENLFVIADSGSRILLSTAVARTLTVDAADTARSTGNIDIDDCDDVLIVMPTEKLEFGAIEAYFLPARIASEEIRMAYRAWAERVAEGAPAPAAFTLGFDPDSGLSGDYSVRWARFRFPYTVKLECTHP